MKRSLAIGTLVVMALAPALWAADAWARAGGGMSSGSRGSRSYSAPSPSRSSGTLSPDRSSSPAASPYQQAPARRSGLLGGLMGGLGGLLIGGMIGSLLFGGMRGGIGLLEILVIGGLAFMAYSWLRRRPQAQPAGVPAGAGAPADPRWEPAARTAIQPEMPAAAPDLDRGLGHLRQMDPRLDPARLGSELGQVFFQIQSAWSASDLGRVRERLTPEMAAALQGDLDRLRAAGRANRIENMLMEATELTEAWQETGRDFVTIRFAASLLDYTLDDATGRVIEGSRTTPVRFEEYWTFVRPVGPNPWQLSAIQQAP